MDIESAAKKGIEWNREITFQLIENWEQYPCLYDPKNGLYHNKHARYDALAKITNSLSGFVAKITADDVKAKLNNLRSQYSHQLSKMKNSSKSGAGTADLYEPNTYWFPKLGFLKQFMKQRKAVSNIDKSITEPLTVELDDTCEVSMDSSSNSPIWTTLPPSEPSPSSTSRPLKRRVPQDDVLSEASNAIRSLSASMSERKYPNDIEAFGEHIKAEMCKVMDEGLRDEAMHEFNNIMFQIKKKHRLLNI